MSAPASGPEDLAGLDPYSLMEAEAARLDQRFSSAQDSDWAQPTRCEGWSTRDLLAHLAASEGYNRACLDGTVQAFLGEMAAKGAVDLASANDIGIHEFDEHRPEQVLELWRTLSAENRDGLRARDGGDIDTTVGPYPARWQAFHLAFELATHADDVGAPVAAGEHDARVEWQARFCRFAIKELKPHLTIDSANGRTRVRGEDVDADLPDEEFVRAVAARLPDDSPLDDGTAGVLSVTP